MKESLRKILIQANPWWEEPDRHYLPQDHYFPREFDLTLLSQEFDDLCFVLTGPRRAGKTTLGLHVCEQLIKEHHRFDRLVYLNCDQNDIREWLTDTLFIQEAFEIFSLKHPIIFIDEVQRLESPGLFLKALIDLALPIKIIATGSAQLELKSKIQEAMTGRNLSTVILPLSIREGIIDWNARLIFGCYPRITLSSHKEILLRQLLIDYIDKDIVKILQIRNAAIVQKLLGLIAHSSGQLVNYNQLAADCGVSAPTIKEYLDILEATYVVSKVTPYVGNKRVEITSNPVYYFFDNGFRNQALNNFLSLEQRTDLGLLVESFVYQELYKYLKQYASNMKIYYWRTKAGAEVDFVLSDQASQIFPIEVKYRNLLQPTVSRGFRSFLEAYAPAQAIIVTKNLIATVEINGCQVRFIPLESLHLLFDLLKKSLT